MSRHYPSQQAYAAAENRLLDLYLPTEPEIENQQRASAIMPSISVRSRSPARRPCANVIQHGVRSYDVHCPLDPSVDSVVHLISDDSDVISLMSDQNSDDFEFSGFSDAERNDNDNNLASNMRNATTMIYGVHRCQQTDDINDHSVVDTQYVENNITETTSLQNANFMSPNMLSESNDSLEQTTDHTSGMYDYPCNLDVMYSDQSSHYANVNQVTTHVENDSYEVVMNDSAYAIETIVANAEQHCVVYGNSTDYSDVNHIMQLPANYATQQDSVLSIQYATQNSYSCQVNQHHMTLSHLALEHINDDSNANAQCLIAMENDCNGQPQENYYEVPHVVDNNIIIYSEDITEVTVNEVFVDNIVDDVVKEILIEDDEVTNGDVNNEIGDMNKISMENANADHVLLNNTSSTYHENISVTSKTEVNEDNKNADHIIDVSDDTTSQGVDTENEEQQQPQNRVEDSAKNISYNLSKRSISEPGACIPHSNISVPDVLEISSIHEVEMIPQTKTMYVLSPAQSCSRQSLPKMPIAADANITRFPTKCAPSTTTEFPNSSNTNQNFSIDELYSLPPQRTSLLKNTLGNDAFDRKLVSICQMNPQLTIEEKIYNWDCPGECSDVEDVASFDQNFEYHEAMQREKSSSSDKIEKEIHDFVEFQKMLLRDVNKTKQQILENSMGQELKTNVGQNTLMPANTNSRNLKKRKSYTEAITSMTTSTTMSDTPSSMIAKQPRLEVKNYDIQEYSSNMTLVPTSSADFSNLPSTQSPNTFNLNTESQTLSTEMNNDETEPQKSKENISTSTTDLLAPQPFTSSCSTTVTATAAVTAPISGFDTTYGGGIVQDAYVPCMSSYNNQVNNITSDNYQSTVITNSAPVIIDRIESTAPQDTNVTQSMPIEDPLYYEQHEFCSYLGLTGHDTANAFTVALQELQNCSVARRSLRLRPQQQLERMRGDTGKSRRKEKQARQTFGVDAEEAADTTTTTIISKHSLECETTKPESADYLSTSDMPADNTLNTICEIPAGTVEEGEKSAQLYNYFSEEEKQQEEQHQLQQNQQEYQTCVGVETSEASAFPRQTINSNPTISTAGTAATQPDNSCTALRSKTLDDVDVAQLRKNRANAGRSHEIDMITTPVSLTENTPNILFKRIQQCLKESREAKPKIYIIESLSSDNKAHAPVSVNINARSSNNIQNPIMNAAVFPLTVDSLQQPKSLSNKIKNSNKIESTAKSSTKKWLKRKTKPGKKIANAKNVKRTAVVHSLEGKEDNLLANKSKTSLLVTRSTTHMNSKILRSRKISLLKSYYLTNESRSLRLKGGSLAVPTLSKKVKTSTVVDKIDERKDLEQKIKGEHIRYHLKKTAAEVASAKQRNVAKALTVTKERTRKLNTNKSSSIVDRSTTTAHAPKINTLSKKHQTVASTKKKAVAATEAHKMCPISNVNFGELSIGMTLSSTDNDRTRNTLTRIKQNKKPKKTITHLRNIDAHEFITNTAVVQPPVNTSAVLRLMQQNDNSTNTNVKINSAVATATETASNGEQRPASPFVIATPALSYTSSSAGGEAKSVQNCENRRDFDITRLTEGSSAQHNPLLGEDGKILHIFYERDILIVIQEKLVSFWKYCKVFNVLQKKNVDMNETDLPTTTTDSENSYGKKTKEDWVHLGRVRRLTNDIEIAAPYPNRICINNSTPIYLEMRCRIIERNQRECNLLSVYINVYYYSEEDLRPKMCSVHLDSVQGDASSIIYTTITESRYFIMAWHQEIPLRKVRSGICKYSLTPDLDTLASIRDFKNLKYELKYIECLTEDKLIGYGNTRVTIWDHRSGDTLMCYDFCIDLGRNLGAIYYPSLDNGHSNILILYQHFKVPDSASELKIIAVEVSSVTPSHRLLHTHKLPTPSFDECVTAINTGDHLIIQSKHNEIWIGADDPHLLTLVTMQCNQRFYSRNRSQVIELTPKTLTVNNIANHMLKLATLSMGVVGEITSI